VTLGVIFGINVAVFVGWQIPQLQDLWSYLFLWSNRSTEEGRWWLWITPSFSHHSFGHLAANMTFFLYLGKRLHQFMGRTRFITLYLAGAVAGSIGSDLNPGYRQDRVAETPARYLNILGGKPVGVMESLGASDAVMAILACWYFVFPRTQIHVFRTVSMMTDLLRHRGFVKLTTFLDKYHPTCSALWFLPLLFVSDFLKILDVSPTSPTSHLSLTENTTNVAAHVAGFTAGGLFHLFVTRPLKAKHFARNWYEMSRRAVLIPLSLSFYSYIMYKLDELHAKHQGLVAVRFDVDDSQKTPAPSPGPDWQSLFGWRTATTSHSTPQQLTKLLKETDLCSAQETYMIHRTATRGQVHKDRLVFGQCDAHFLRVRKAIEEAEADTQEDVAGSIKLREPTPEEAEALEKWAAQTERAQKTQSMTWGRYVSFIITGR
jgi:membrane associated rhomboid family serine protease